MEGMKMEEPWLTPTEDADICTSILTCFGNSTREDHQHLCAVIGGMAQGFKDQNVPSSPVAYFGAACSSLDRSTLIGARTLLRSHDRRPPHNSLHGHANNNWSQLYGFLLSFATNSRPKVRRQSHLRLHDVLQSFQGTCQLAPASAGIADLFKRFLVLASGKDTQGPPKRAVEMLFVLDCLKECIALMSTMCKNDVLHHCKLLLELNPSPLITRRITDILHRLCLNPCPDVAPQILLDLLCSLSLSVSNINDDMTFTARLLHVGMAKVYSLNKKMCVIKLPTVFNALRDILGSKHEEATHAAVNTFKSLIHACIDESLIKEGIDQFVMRNERRSGPTIIEKLCATIENLVGYHYTPVLDLAFQVVSAMFDKLGVYSYFLFRKQRMNASERLLLQWDLNFLGFLPLRRLKTLVGEQMSNKSEQLKSQGHNFSSRSADALVYSLWSLLPSFCNYPSDTAESFNDLKKALCGALRCKPQIRGIVCLSLQILVQQNKKIPEEVNDLSDSEVDVFLETKKDETTKDDGGKHTKNETTKDDGRCLQSTIDAEAVDVLFTNLIKPGLQDDEGLRQKKAYKALSIILGDFDGFISSKLEELLGLMVELLPSCHFSARRRRLDCLYLLIVHVSKSETEQRRHDIISYFLIEIILGLKETNKKTRNKSYDTLVQIGRAYGDEENLHQFFNMVAGGLAGETPDIISAAMRGLARLAYEFSDLVPTASNLLPSTFLLLQRKNREIIKASLGLSEGTSSKSQAEGLQLHLKSMVEALLKWQDDTKTHFKAKKCLSGNVGWMLFKAVMPQEHLKLLTNIRKIKERKERKQLASKSEEAKSLASRATTARLSRWNHSKVFSDIDDEETDDYMDAPKQPLAGVWQDFKAQIQSMFPTVQE
ncbi:hypothetical protein M0R45_011641 [Rubus argutus]|uniref:Ribosomal RNA-processing protein 12-like conserved domain-containing protein n=1 Tax=Rubus argutus TaxID=59490 RepID=A0AAW1YC70_RUBAR